MTRRDDDIAILVQILRPANGPALSQAEHDAFRELHASLASGDHGALSKKQRRWAEETAARLRPIAAASVPVWRAVHTPEMLRPENLPKRPPHRRHEI